ncbi:hypothetical protein H8356DRAFT_1430474 [Neocallimastix lanati (nom. inval.)]|nr:hypothetical protein H8356DRAFT_1430474 [Neocallimastix sp. JGI-2020a]
MDTYNNEVIKAEVVEENNNEENKQNIQAVIYYLKFMEDQKQQEVQRCNERMKMLDGLLDSVVLNISRELKTLEVLEKRKHVLGEKIKEVEALLNYIRDQYQSFGRQYNEVLFVDCSVFCGDGGVSNKRNTINFVDVEMIRYRFSPPDERSDTDSVVNTNTEIITRNNGCGVIINEWEKLETIASNLELYYFFCFTLRFFSSCRRHVYGDKEIFRIDIDIKFDACVAKACLMIEEDDNSNLRLKHWLSKCYPFRMNNAESNTDSDSCNKVYIISINNYNNSDSIINIDDSENNSIVANNIVNRSIGENRVNFSDMIIKKGIEKFLFKNQIISGDYSKTAFLVRSAALFTEIMPRCTNLK